MKKEFGMAFQDVRSAENTLIELNTDNESEDSHQRYRSIKCGIQKDIVELIDNLVQKIESGKREYNNKTKDFINQHDNKPPEDFPKNEKASSYTFEDNINSNASANTYRAPEIHQINSSAKRFFIPKISLEYENKILTSSVLFGENSAKYLELGMKISTNVSFSVLYLLCNAKSQNLEESIHMRLVSLKRLNIYNDFYAAFLIGDFLYCANISGDGISENLYGEKKVPSFGITIGKKIVLTDSINLLFEYSFIHTSKNTLSVTYNNTFHKEICFGPIQLLGIGISFKL
ncbi:hypothetical protein Cyrtocomes_01094 [Candidatus Cyrtobacter comes]|uniref:Outer membrane protein beta-barrel domain-containing protein n=1 Tax=Candidatus Cyrtobacter comes TaxID=675776 RepID=A0ABU5L997_9RICK|nr:hypothetical protein [Candidatus Cyrtobacter comes]MDZ5762702.1 hypothetical protein [Candidatus Cyrtobacter comes]